MDVLLFVVQKEDPRDDAMQHSGCVCVVAVRQDGLSLVSLVDFLFVLGWRSEQRRGSAAAAAAALHGGQTLGFTLRTETEVELQTLACRWKLAALSSSRTSVA